MTEKYNPFLPSGLFHPYQLDESIFKFRDVRCAFFTFILFRIEIPVSKQLLQHQKQEYTIGKNFCFWLLNCTKGNSTKGKKNDTIGNNFSHLHHK